MAAPVATVANTPIMTTEAVLSMPITPRANGWYRQRSSTGLLDPVVGVDNDDDEGEQKLAELERNLTINCLHRGANLKNARRKFMVAVDGTLASKRALTATLKLMTNPDDHIVVVHVWEPANPIEFGALTWEEIGDPFLMLKTEYRNWLAGKEILRDYYITLVNLPIIDNSNFTCIFLPDLDHRDRVCRLAQEFKVTQVSVGKHKPEDKRYRKKNWHRKTFRSYVKSHSHTRVLVVE